MISNMERPNNPYKRGSIIWAIMEGGLQSEFDGLPGWDDMSIAQIAEALDASYTCVQSSLTRIEKETGYRVKRVRAAYFREGMEVDDE